MKCQIFFLFNRGWIWVLLLGVAKMFYKPELFFNMVLTKVRTAFYVMSTPLALRVEQEMGVIRYVIGRIIGSCIDSSIFSVYRLFLVKYFCFRYVYLDICEFYLGVWVYYSSCKTLLSVVITVDVDSFATLYECVCLKFRC